MSETEQKRPTRQEEVKTERRRREDSVSGRNLKLHVPDDAKDPNFVYRFINARPGRVQQLTRMDDYDVVSSTEMDSKSLGTTVERIGNQQDGEKMILVRKPKEYFEADKAKEHELIRAREKAIEKAAPPSPEGLSGPNAYVPGGKNTIGR